MKFQNYCTNGFVFVHTYTKCTPGNRSMQEKKLTQSVKFALKIIARCSRTVGEFMHEKLHVHFSSLTPSFRLCILCSGRGCSLVKLGCFLLRPAIPHFFSVYERLFPMLHLKYFVCYLLYQNPSSSYCMCTYGDPVSRRQI